MRNYSQCQRLTLFFLSVVPTGMSINTVEASAVTPVIAGYSQIKVTGYAAHYNITVLTMNARATL
ncbi:hypothetical protein VR7878_02053 [Vibrio ruber DSM 16370]|uniref:Uncharacterized protein n=1 Tax=Vibrio ruber (strain DSM 16370 / JCM 11486 / BCRC 17186 / CECT 7878 / LMG 23124 / VR1) TaxID=1123498 RepID=A0A1R4LKH8_VIBR1|nr:hypothetical protein VR7878_02053 [Vibrio ruber DSM 16370]